MKSIFFMLFGVLAGSFIALQNTLNSALGKKTRYFGSIFILPKIGVSSTLSSMIFGQIILALILDHFGFMGNPTIAIDLKKILGVFFF